MRPARGFPGCGQGVDLGMRPAKALMPALADHLAIPHDYGANKWVWLDVAAAALRKLQGAAHPRLKRRHHLGGPSAG